MGLINFDAKNHLLRKCSEHKNFIEKKLDLFLKI